MGLKLSQGFISKSIVDKIDFELHWLIDDITDSITYYQIADKTRESVVDLSIEIMAHIAQDYYESPNN